MNISEKFAGGATLLSGVGVGISWLDIIHKLMQIGAAGVSIVAGSFAIYVYVKNWIKERRNGQS